MVYEILVVDDSDFMRTMLKGMLEDVDGFEVVDEAENGVEALTKYEEHQPDVVMMDIVMPIKDGIEATKAIKEEPQPSKVIMCTSVGQEEKMKQAMKVGADSYLTKPFEKDNVVTELQDATG